MGPPPDMTARVEPGAWRGEVGVGGASDHAGPPPTPGPLGPPTRYARKGEGESTARVARVSPYTSFTFFSGRLRTGLPVAAWIALSTAGATTQMVGSPTPPQKS